jgi:hypothetical protein
MSPTEIRHGAVMLFEPNDRDRIVAGAEQASRILEQFLRVILWAVAAAVLVGAVLIMVDMDASSKSQGGRLYIAVAAMVALGAVDRQFGWLARRRCFFFESAGYFRYGMRSLLLLALSAVLLFGLALYFHFARRHPMIIDLLVIEK